MIILVHILVHILVVNQMICMCLRQLVPEASHVAPYIASSRLSSAEFDTRFPLDFAAITTILLLKNPEFRFRDAGILSGSESPLSACFKHHSLSLIGIL